MKPWILGQRLACGRPRWPGRYRGLQVAGPNVAQGEGELVLVVDDLADMHELIAGSLKKKNYRVAMTPMVSAALKTRVSFNRA